MRNIEFPSSILLVIRMNVQCGWIFKECTKNQTNRQTPTKQTYLDITFILHILYYTLSLENSTRLAVDRVKPWLRKMINSRSSNTMIPIGNLDLGHLIDTLNYLATPTLKSSRFLITFSWIM